METLNILPENKAQNHFSMESMSLVWKVDLYAINSLFDAFMRI